MLLSKCTRPLCSLMIWNWRVVTAGLIGCVRCGRWSSLHTMLFLHAVMAVGFGCSGDSFVRIDRDFAHDRCVDVTRWWWRRRDSEFAHCSRLHPGPTLGPSQFLEMWLTKLAWVFRKKEKREKLFLCFLVVVFCCEGMASTTEFSAIRRRSLS